MKKDGYLAVYDFDTHLYTGALLLEEKYIIAKQKATGHEMEHKNITAFKGRKKYVMEGWLGKRNEEKGTNLTLEDFEITHHARRNRIPMDKAKEMIRKSITIVLEKPWCRELKLVIGGKDNYRKRIWDQYKANRGPKPLMYAEMREWLEDEFSDLIIIAEDCEADDYLSIMSSWMKRQAGDDFDKWDLVLIHRDKDMVQCGGLQWDWHKKTKDPLWVGNTAAGKSLWKQMLQGDSTDNIPGIGGVTEYIWKEFGLKGKGRGIGEKNALILLDGYDSVREMEEMVIYCYRTYYDSIGEDWQRWFQLNYQLLKLQDKKGVIPTYEFKESYPKLDEDAEG